MTLSSTISSVSYAGDDGTTIFSFPYLFLADGDLVVTLAIDSTGVETTQTITTHYTVDGAGDQSGGVVTMVTAPATGETLVIERVPAATQDLDLVENDPFPSDLVEQALDRGAMVDQVADERYTRTVHFQKSDTYTGGEPHLPILADRKGKTLAFDETTGDFVAQSVAEIGTVIISGADPQPLGVAAPGSTGDVSDAGHIHKLPTDAELGLEIGVDVLAPDGNGSNLTGIVADLPLGYLSGLGMSNGTDTDHDIDVAAGACRGVDDDEDITLSAITKQIDATWAAGTAAGGLSSSLTAPANDTWYHVFAIVVSGSADVGFDTSVTGSNLVTDHSATAVRRIGSVLTNGSANIIAFTQDGDDFYWDNPPLDVNTANPGISAVTSTLSTPTGLAIIAVINALMTATATVGLYGFYISPLTADDEAPSFSAAPLMQVAGDIRSTDDSIAGQINVLTNTSAQVRYRQLKSAADSTFLISTTGWIDRRGKA